MIHKCVFILYIFTISGDFLNRYCGIVENEPRNGAETSHCPSTSSYQLPVCAVSSVSSKQKVNKKKLTPEERVRITYMERQLKKLELGMWQQSARLASTKPWVQVSDPYKPGTVSHGLEF